MLVKLSFGLIIIGVLVLVGWALKGFFGDPNVPLLLRIAVGAVGAGFILLLAAVTRDRILKSRNEKNKEEPRW